MSCVAGETRIHLNYKALEGTATTFWGFKFFMTDFSGTKFYCSLLYNLMTEVNGKSPFDHWQDACDLLTLEEAKYEAMPKKGQIPAIKKAEKIEGLKLKIAELALTKDDDVLSEGCKNQLLYLYGWLKYKKWTAPENVGYNKSGKGISVENLSIEMINRLDGTNYSKNEEKFTNEYLIGCPDVIDNENKIVVDVKSSWNMDSFLCNVNKELNKIYWWQIQGYMALLGFEKAEISFCLVSTPEHIILSEIDKKAGGNYSEEEIRQNLTFDDIAEEERRLRFVVDRDEEAIEKLYKRIRKCREYMPIIEQLHLGMK